MSRNTTIPENLLELVRTVLQPFDDGGREIEGIPDEDGYFRCVLPLLDGIGQLFLTQTRLGRTVRVSVKVGGILYRNLRPHLKRMGMRLRLRWRERMAVG